MISLTALQKQLFSAVRLLAGTGLPLEIIYNHKVYQLYVRPTDIKPLYNRPLRPGKRKPKINTWQLNYGDCRACGYLTVNDNCLNFDCPTLKTDPPRLFNFKRAEQEAAALNEMKRSRNAGEAYPNSIVAHDSAKKQAEQTTGNDPEQEEQQDS